MALAWFERYDGLAAIVAFVDRAGGVLESIVWFDSLRSLRGSASRTQELRDLLVADIPEMKVVDDVELHAVIAEMTGLSSTTA